MTEYKPAGKLLYGDKVVINNGIFMVRSRVNVNGETHIDFQSCNENGLAQSGSMGISKSVDHQYFYTLWKPDVPGFSQEEIDSSVEWLLDHQEVDY